MNAVIEERVIEGNRHLQLVQGDITQENVDAIVNAANTHLAHGGGVAAAIVRRGGAIIQTESNQWVQQHGPVTHAYPATTSAGALPCRWVIHAVGPIWGEGDEEAKLATTIQGVLLLSDQLQLSTLTIPAISTGIYSFPKQLAAQIILSQVHDYLSNHPGSHLRQVRVILFDEADLAIFRQVWFELWPA